MKFIRYCLRPLLWLVAGCGLLGLPMFGQAQGVTVTPAAPEAYQPFTIEWFECARSDGLHDVDVDIAIDTRVVTASVRAIYVRMVLPQDCGGVPLDRRRVANVPGLPGGVYQILAPVDGDQFLLPYPPVEVGTATVSPGPYNGPIREFRNRTTLHYFLAADSSEANSLVQGGGGGGWYYSTGIFGAWPLDYPAPAAARPVCRFYSSLVNSHFYTAGANECELLKQPGSGWAYEGIAFRALVPTNGACYPGTRPVWRLYNGRFAQNDSNHRFVTSVDVYRHMIANGWIGEGVVFCEPAPV